MSVTAFQITGHMPVCSTACSGCHKTLRFCMTGPLCRESSGDRWIPDQTSNTENVSMTWLFCDFKVSYLYPQYAVFIIVLQRSVLKRALIVSNHRGGTGYGNCSCRAQCLPTAVTVHSASLVPMVKSSGTKPHPFTKNITTRGDWFQQSRTACMFRFVIDFTNTL